MNKRDIGKYGEEIAAGYLHKNGFDILARNFRSGRYGEIDIVAQEKEYICFIEVKTRSGNLFGTPAEAVGHAKREKLRALAWIYLKENKMGERNMRFDIVEVTGRRNKDSFIPENINLIRGAF